MIEKKFNPTSLARKARLNVTAVRDILQHVGDPNPRIDTFFKLCRALDVGPHQLSPDFATLYSPRQCGRLDEAYELDKKDRKLHRASAKEKSRKNLYR